MQRRALIIAFIVSFHVFTLTAMETQPQSDVCKSSLPAEVTLSRVASLKQIAFDASARRLTEEVFPQLRDQLVKTIKEQFPDNVQELSFYTAQATLIAISQINAHSACITLSPVSLKHSLHDDLDTPFKALFEKVVLTEPLLGTYCSQEYGLVARCLEEVSLTYHCEFNKPKENLLSKEFPILWSCIEKRMDAIRKVLDTKCQLPERNEMKAQLKQFEDMLSNTDLLNRLAGKDFKVIQIGGQFQMALADYGTYLQEKKKYSESKAFVITQKIQDEMLQLLFKNYPHVWQVLKKCMDKTSELMAKKMNNADKLLAMPSEKKLRTRLSAAPLDYLVAKTNVIELFADKKYTPEEVLEKVDSMLDEFSERMIRGGMKNIQGLMIAQACKLDLLRALFADYPFMLEIVEKTHEESI